MEFRHDPQADAIYIYLREKAYSYGIDLDDERRIDYASDDTPIGVELLCVSKGVNLDDLPRKDEIAEILEHNRIEAYTMEGYPVEEGGILFNIKLASPETKEAEMATAQLKAREEVTV